VAGVVSSEAVPKDPRILVFLKKAVGEGKAEVEDKALLAQRREAREDHENAKAALKSTLEGMPISVRYVTLPAQVEAEGYDLVVALGGDGTVLHASHQIGTTPVLAINSSPRHSVGYLTAGTMEGVGELVERALASDLDVTRLQRMAVDIDGRRVYGRVLNDVLFTHECPASTARYLVRLGEVEEQQMSSGIWVGPAAGSTAALRTAGGKVLPPGSRKIQFVVREPYYGRGDPYRLVKGLVDPGDRLAVQSMMDSARLYVDGPHVMIPVRLGETVELSLSEEPLTVLGFRRPELKRCC
jgi:NAD+ kinase